MSDKKKSEGKLSESTEFAVEFDTNWVSDDTSITLAEPQPNIIIFHAGDEQIEILKFTDDKMFLYGKETECPQDIIDGMKEWMTGHNRLENVEKARKYDEIMSLIKKQE